MINKKEIERVKRLEFKILKDIDEVCRENNIKYYLIGGTLLGAVRHGGFIPWDDDIDIVMFRDEYNKFVKLFRNFDESYFLQNFETDSH